MDTDHRDAYRRRAKGKAVWPAWKASIESAIGHCVETIDLVSLEYTAQLRDRFYSIVRDGNHRHRFYPKDDLGRLLAAMRSLMCAQRQKVVIFHSMDSVLGALRIEAELIAESMESVWIATQEDLSFATDDLLSGICLEENFYDGSGSYVAGGVLELTSWGQFQLD